jgi:O-phospho-L-seryl-tRNASec:L-selenocysteinyl-tRNA synthase
MTVDKIEKPSGIGGQLFYRGVSGIRVVDKNAKKDVIGISFKGYGSHTDAYPSHYLTVACAIGIQKQDIDKFMLIFDKVLEKHYSSS